MGRTPGFSAAPPAAAIRIWRTAASGGSSGCRRRPNRSSPR